MSDTNRKVNNPLFNAAVTGGTFEEFSQNALLLPAKEKPPPPVLNITQEQILSDNRTNNYNTPAVLEPTFDVFQNQPQKIIPSAPPLIEEVDLQPAPTNSNLASVFSSFSNILKIKPQAQPEQDVAVPPPAGIEFLINQDTTDRNVEPVPLFPAVGNSFVATKPTSVPQGPVNTFRRTGLKRPTYAPVPGLSGPASTPNYPPVQQSPQTTNNYFQPSPFVPSVETQFPSRDPTPPQFSFKPISPSPSNFTVPPQIPQPLVANINPQPFFVNQSFNSLQSPVMAAIPASEALQNSDMNNPANNYPANANFPPTITTNQIYRPVYHHWFFKKEIEEKDLWQPFSMVDSLALEQAFTSNDLDPDKVIATDGGRYDVNILRRERIPVYWKGKPSEVRRCSWFHKTNSDGRYLPYDENVATKLEEEFKAAFENNQWNKNVLLANGETVVFHGPELLVLLPPTTTPDAWGNTPNKIRPRMVKRGMDEFDIDNGEPAKVDHLLFMVHGIGSVCDLKFRSVEEVVDEFRSIALQLVESHYHSSCEKGIANRVEVLPISWHDKLHSEDTGIDKALKSITLESIPRLRDFTNDTLLDILFYTSPVYCQTIISSVGNELNRIYDLFKHRNPSFTGGVSLGGHSLGSLILFDLLGHQHPEPEPEESNGGDDVLGPLNESKPPPLQRRMSRRISYMMGSVGTGQPQIHYPHLSFQPKAFFALGSPIGMFVTVRGLDTLGEQFALPTCPAFFNIFHPYDPVAYRVESLINSELSGLKPVLIPHHKGRKRMHLELKETMARVGADLKQRVVDSMKSTFNSFYQLAMFHRQDAPAPSLEDEVNKAFEEKIDQSEEPLQEQTDLSLGILNKGRRIDYVLQEAPFEFFNEYIFAITSHVCYWESEDTMLLMLKEIYSSMNISTDIQVPQQTMTIERAPSSPTSSRAAGMNPTSPIHENINLRPPPTSGFVKKT